MTLPASGQITYDQINVELGNTSGTEAANEAMIIASSGGPGSLYSPPDNISEWYGYTHPPPAPNPPTNVTSSYFGKSQTITVCWTNSTTSGSTHDVRIYQSPTGWDYTNVTTCYGASPFAVSSGTYECGVRAVNGGTPSAYVWANPDITT